MTLPLPVITEHDGFLVVRDDLLPGGTKRRALHVLFDDEHDTYVYASPAYGYAQIALALACRDHGKRAVLMVAKRKTYAPLTQQAVDAGAVVIEVPMGFLAVTQARAREYAASHERTKLVPFGLDDPTFIETLAESARSLSVTPAEVWTVTSSGVFSRALQLAWPHATFFGVQVGAAPNAGRCVQVFRAPERFEKDAKFPPPFPSCLNYDAKVWQFMKQHASPGALFWNVGA